MGFDLLERKELFLKKIQYFTTKTPNYTWVKYKTIIYLKLKKQLVKIKNIIRKCLILQNTSWPTVMEK